MVVFVLCDDVIIGIDIGIIVVKVVVVDDNGWVMVWVWIGYQLVVLVFDWLEYDVDEVWWWGLLVVLDWLVGFDIWVLVVVVMVLLLIVVDFVGWLIIFGLLYGDVRGWVLNVLVVWVQLVLLVGEIVEFLCWMVG